MGRVISPDVVERRSGSIASTRYLAVSSLHAPDISGFAGRGMSSHRATIENADRPIPQMAGTTKDGAPKLKGCQLPFPSTLVCRASGGCFQGLRHNTAVPNWREAEGGVCEQAGRLDAHVRGPLNDRIEILVEGELSLTCRTCGRRFASALQIEVATFLKLRIVDHHECCHACGSVHRYQKTDYFFFVASIKPE